MLVILVGEVGIQPGPWLPSQTNWLTCRALGWSQNKGGGQPENDT